VLVELGLAESAEEWRTYGEASGEGNAAGTLWVVTPRVYAHDLGPRLIVTLDIEHGGSRIYQPLPGRQVGTNRDRRGPA